MKQLFTVAALVALSASPAGAQPTSPQSTSLSGKIVDLATYITADHNMDAMKTGHAMTGAAMKGDAMKGDAMAADGMKGEAMTGICPPMLGVVTSAGRAYPLAFQEGSTTAAAACKHLNATATLTGKSYSQGGATLFLVSAIQ